MAEPKKLTLGVHCKSPGMREEETRVAVLEATIEHYLPGFVKAVKKLKPAARDKEGDILWIELATRQNHLWLMNGWKRRAAKIWRRCDKTWMSDIATQ
ncbi:hypothetical protein [Allorhodopirellula solitaria]|uniref:Uncharacterized protein n=1 Tax=Allorhodopirellula solitaria TaxID=2527987 RepID=A0A5C5YIY1_9BACT|nr:hypothetical protein [Allorhodopirellula solitaria]TWT74820.1 hypothetical protein CA85_01060 [Allorhodopirellula solitaria]